MTEQEQARLEAAMQRKDVSIVEPGETVFEEPRHSFLWFIMVWVIAMMIGFVNGLIWHDEMPWNKPVRSKAFSFDRIASLQNELDGLKNDLIEARYVLTQWQAKARDLLAVTQSREDVTVQMWDGKTLSIPCTENVTIKDCFFLPRDTDPNEARAFVDEWKE